MLNSHYQILVIQEKFAHMPDYWKLPGGTVDRGEDLHRAVVRVAMRGVATVLRRCGAARCMMPIRTHASACGFI